MALLGSLACPHCEATISGTEFACPYCGCTEIQDMEGESAVPSWVWLMALAIVLIAAGIDLAFGGHTIAWLVELLPTEE